MGEGHSKSASLLTPPPQKKSPRISKSASASAVTTFSIDTNANPDDSIENATSPREKPGHHKRRSITHAKLKIEKHFKEKLTKKEEKEKKDEEDKTLKKRKSKSFTKKLMIFESSEKMQLNKSSSSPTQETSTYLQRRNTNTPPLLNNVDIASSLTENRRHKILQKSEQALSGTQNIIMQQVLYQNPLQSSTRNVDKKLKLTKSDDTNTDKKNKDKENKDKENEGNEDDNQKSDEESEKNEEKEEGGGYLFQASNNKKEKKEKKEKKDKKKNKKENTEGSEEGGGYLTQAPKVKNDNEGAGGEGGGYLLQSPSAKKEKTEKKEIGEIKGGGGGGYIMQNQNQNQNQNQKKPKNEDSEDDNSFNKNDDSDSEWGGFSSDDNEKKNSDNDHKEKPKSTKETKEDSEKENVPNTNPNFLNDLLAYFATLNPEDLQTLGKEIANKYPKIAEDLGGVIDDFKAEKMLLEGDDDDDEPFDMDSSDEEREKKAKHGHLFDVSGEDTDIDHLLDVSCNWNQRFQVCIEMLKHHGQIHERRVQIFLHLSNLAQDFIHCAKTYGRIIISEAETPIEFKTIKPTKIGGFAGGDKYIVNNIMFKFAVDSHNLFDVEEAAIKIAGHDLKGLISYFNLGIEGLHFPLMALVDYLGYRLIAMSVLPIGKDTIVYGSSDAGRTIRNSCPILSYKMQFAAKMLNLKRHLVGEKMVEMFSAADLEGHDVDGVYYLLDFSRSFPPTSYDQQYRNSYLYRLFRSEFVKNYPASLCADTYSGFAVDSAEEYIKEIEEATIYLKTRTIPKFGDTLNQMSDRDVAELNLKEALHEAGINLRYLGNLRHEVKREDIKQMILVEMIARIIKHELRSKMKQQMRELKLPLEHSCREMVIAHLNLVFGKSPESEYHFNHSVKEHLLRNFEEALSDTEKEGSLKLLLSGKDQCMLFRIVQQMTSLVFTSSAQNEFSYKENAFEFENPFHVTDLEEIGVRVRHLNIVALAQGYVLKNQARKLGKNSERLCKLALEKFKQALSDNPGDIRALRELADASNLLGDKEAADMYYKRATTISNDPNTLFKYAVFLEENKKIEEAEEYYLRTLEKDAKHDHCLQRYGYFLENQGNHDSAEKFFIRASQIRSRSHSVSSSKQPNFEINQNFLF